MGEDAEIVDVVEKWRVTLVLEPRFYVFVGQRGGVRWGIQHTLPYGKHVLYSKLYM